MFKLALLLCKYCGKQVSDKAKICPACKHVLTEDHLENESVISSIKCEECGYEIPQDADACPNCGFPIEKSISDDKMPSLGDSNNSTEIKTKKSKITQILIVIIIILILAIIGFLIGNKIYSDNKKAQEAEEATKAAIAAQELVDTYKENLIKFKDNVSAGGFSAEIAGNVIHSVWYNAIFEVKDSITDKYTRPNGKFVEDFNDALRNLFNDPSFAKAIDSMKALQEDVSKTVNDLRNPPEGYEKTYEAIKDCYDSFVAFTNMVISPSGSLSSFSSEFNSANSNFNNKLDVLNSFSD